MRTLMQGHEEEPIVIAEDVPVIVSSDKPVAIAGVIGSEEARVTAETHRVLIESASFDMLAVRRSQSRMKIFTEASARFSRGVDSALTEPAVQRILAILRLTCPALRVMAFAHASGGDNAADAPLEVELAVDEVISALGIELTPDEILDPLERLDFRCTVGKDRTTVTVVVPSARGDITQPCDLIEEVARIRGYDELPATMPIDPVPLHRYDKPLHAREQARDALVEVGLQEVITYTLTSPEMTQALAAGANVPIGPVLRLLNPISVERSVARRSLIPGLLQTYRDNRRYRPGSKLFEIGVVVLPETPSVDPRLPFEQMRACVVIGGPAHEATVHEREPRNVDFFDVKAVVQRLLGRVRVAPVTFEAAETPPFVAGACARVGIAEKTCGY